MIKNNSEIYYLMSIETGECDSFMSALHLGSDENAARRFCEDRYFGRLKAGLAVVSVSLFDSNYNIVDVFMDDKWFYENDSDRDVNHWE